ncbi:MAG: tetratricopeptide repeat protein, partial [Deltaproteobacteria bacterium]|nr:tetratricopeptide repeat protein [Deltaproteobacteria bacterium]
MRLTLATPVLVALLACGGGQVKDSPSPISPVPVPEPEPVPGAEPVPAPAGASSPASAPAAADAGPMAAEGLALLRGGDLRAGRDRLQLALASGAADPVAYYNLAVADLKLGDAVAAEEHARKAAEFSKGAPKALALLSRVMLGRGRADLLATFLEGLAESLPESVPVRLALVRAKIAAGRAADALRDATEMLRKDEANTEVMKAIARAYVAMDRKDAARFVLGQVIEIRKDAEALDLLAHLSLSAGEDARAAALFRQAVDLDPSYADAHNNIGVLLQKSGDHEGATAAFLAALKADPDYAPARMNLGNSLKKSFDFDAAIAAYKEAIRIDPACADCYFNLGVAEIENRGSGPDEPAHYRRAMEHFRTYKEMNRVPRRDDEADKYQDEARRMAEKLEAEAARMREAPPPGPPPAEGAGTGTGTDGAG